MTYLNLQLCFYVYGGKVTKNNAVYQIILEKN